MKAKKANRVKHGRKRSGLRAFVSAECANWSNGSCLGAAWDETGAPILGGNISQCLATRRLRCAYFEKCLAPLALVKPEYAGGLAEYQRSTGPNANRTTDSCRAWKRGGWNGDVTKHPFWIGGDESARAISKRTCPDCGAPLRKYHTYCPECVKKRRRESFRSEKHRQRQK